MEVGMFGTFLELIQQIIRHRKIHQRCYMIPRVMFINFYNSVSREYGGDSPLLPKKRFTQNSETKANVLFSESESRSVVSNSLRSHGLYSPWNSPGQNTGVSSHYLLQGIFPTQGSNPGLLHCRRILYQLSLGKPPRILEWVAYSLSSRSCV